MDFNHYFTNHELKETLQEWANAYPSLLSLSQIGESYEKRPIWLLTLTNQATGLDLEKPAVWFDANIHAVEVTGTTTCLHVAHTLLENYGKDETITRLLDHATFYIVPRVNPDGAELAMAKPPQYVRSGVRPYPWLDKEEGLHEQDIDSDGRILQMRIPDPSGDWKVSSLNPRLMEKRQPNEQGDTYYRLLPEGYLEDYDGFLIKLARPVQDLDFNRNFPFEWRPENQQSGAGPYPTSEAETKALVDFITAHPNINLAITYHTFSRVILRPYSTKSDDEMETEDLWVYKKIGEIGTKLTGYRSASVFHDFKYHPKEVTSGAFDDWLYDHLGMFSFTIELWDLPTEAGIKERKFIEWFRDHPHEEDVQILKWTEEHAAPEAYMDWYSFEHPQLGKIELGGWNLMYTWWNPPTQWVGAEASRITPFAIALGNMLPQIRIHTLEVSSLGENDFRVNLVVENTGFLPSYTSKQGKNRKCIRPVRAELELPESVKIINGKRRVELGHLEGRSNKLNISTLWNVSQTDNRARVEWVLHGNPGDKVQLHILSERAGAIHRTIELI